MECLWFDLELFKRRKKLWRQGQFAMIGSCYHEELDSIFRFIC